jgi:hypothetical protein
MIGNIIMTGITAKAGLEVMDRISPRKKKRRCK